MPPLSDDQLGEVLSTVRLVPRWRLSPAAWEGMEAALRTLQRAIGSDDERATFAALAEVERFGPTRLASIGADQEHGPGHDERVPPPEPVVELLNTLVHPTGGWSPSGGGRDRGGP